MAGDLTSILRTEWVTRLNVVDRLSGRACWARLFSRQVSEMTPAQNRTRARELDAANGTYLTVPSCNWQQNLNLQRGSRRRSRVLLPVEVVDSIRSRLRAASARSLHLSKREFARTNYGHLRSANDSHCSGVLTLCAWRPLFLVMRPSLLESNFESSPS